MKRKPLAFTILLSVFFFTLQAQTAEEVFDQYLTAVKNLKTLSYRMHRIDSFISGHLQDTYGDCTLKRVESDSLFSFYFKGKQNGVDNEDYYIGTEFFTLHAETMLYEVETEQIHFGLLGSPGGQMALAEMVYKIENYSSLSLSQTDSSYILTFGLPPNQEFQITDRILQLHLYKKNLLPFYRYHKLYGFGDKQVNIAHLSQIENQ